MVEPPRIKTSGTSAACKSVRRTGLSASLRAERRQCGRTAELLVVAAGPRDAAVHARNADRMHDGEDREGAVAALSVLSA